MCLRRADLTARLHEGHTVFREGTPHPFRRLGARHAQPFKNALRRQQRVGGADAGLPGRRTCSIAAILRVSGAAGPGGYPAPAVVSAIGAQPATRACACAACGTAASAGRAAPRAGSSFDMGETRWSVRTGPRPSTRRWPETRTREVSS